MRGRLARAPRSPAVLAYGSLLNRGELAKKDFAKLDLVAVKVNGFRRQFRQEPSWRPGSGLYRGVLDAFKHEGGAINAVAMAGLSGAMLSELDSREVGYSRIQVAHERIEPYDGGRSDAWSRRDFYIYTGKRHKTNPELLPNLDYLEICLAGARQWGDLFFEDFLEMTFVGNTSLRRFIVSSEHDRVRRMLL